MGLALKYLFCFSKLAIIDTNSVLKIFDMTTKVQRDELTNFKRNDVWSVIWSEDNPEMFASMEKTKMHIFRDVSPEVKQTLKKIDN